MRLSDKQRVSVWDLLEGHKNPAPLSWAWFGAVKIERKPLAYEETHRLLKYHTHSLVKPSSYFYEPLPLPPEDLEPLQDKVKDDMKADTPTSDQSPNPTGKKGKSQARKRKQKGTTTPQNQQQLGQAQGLPGQTQIGQQSGMIVGQLQSSQGQQQQQQQQIAMTPQQTMQQIQNANLSQIQMGGHMNQMNPQHMQQQYQQQNQNQMMAQQLAQQQTLGQVGHTGMPGLMGPQQQQAGPNQMGFAGSGGVNSMNNPMGQNSAASNQQWGGYNPMAQQAQQQQQQPQMFYNQAMAPGLNRFDRPQLNSNPKQVLSTILRARGSVHGAALNPGAPGFMQQSQRNPQQPFMRGPIRPVIPNQMVGAGMTATAGGTMMGSGGSMIQTNLLNQQGSGMVNQGLGNAAMGGNALMGQGSGNTNTSGMGNPSMMGIQNIQQSSNMNPGMVNQGMNSSLVNTGMLGQSQGTSSTGALGNTGMMGMPNMQQGGMQAGMFQGQGGPYQNYPNYGNQGMGQQSGQGMMSNFNQMGQQRNTQADYIAQQRALAARGGQYGQHAPNVTMNNMVNQGTVPPYPRQGGNASTAAAQNQQQFQQQQRLRQQMMMQQGSSLNTPNFSFKQPIFSGMAQQGNTQGMVQNQGQGMSQQQTPNLVAQLQRQMPNQGNMMGQQYSHQPPPY